MSRQELIRKILSLLNRNKAFVEIAEELNITGVEVQYCMRLHRLENFCSIEHRVLQDQCELKEQELKELKEKRSIAYSALKDVLYLIDQP